MVEKKRCDRRLTVYLSRVPVMKPDPDRFDRSVEWLKENSLMGGSRGRAAPIPSPNYSYFNPIFKREEGVCMFHTEFDADNENFKNTSCNCRDSVMYRENKAKHQDNNFLEQILANANFDDFPPLRKLKEDTGTQTDERVYKYTCKVCYSKFDSLEFFKHHQGFHNLKNYGCCYCNATFLTSKKLKNHMYEHLNRNFYECLNCPAAFEHKNDLKKHMRSHKELGKWLSCKICPAKFDRTSDLEKHRMKHTTSSSGKLVHVFRKIKEVNSVPRTSSIDVPAVNNVVQVEDASNHHGCRKCKKLTFATYGQLMKHELIHKRKDGAYVCQVCAGRFRSNSGMMHHQKRAH